MFAIVLRLPTWPPAVGGDRKLVTSTGQISNRGWFVTGAASGVALTAAVVTLWTLVPVFCSAVGYLDLSPIQLELSSGIAEDAEVFACFDLDCFPQSAERDADGVFSVPQPEPNLDPASTAGVGSIGVYVEVHVDGIQVAADRFGIEAISDAPFWSRRPGPFRYGPVTVGG